MPTILVTDRADEQQIYYTEIGGEASADNDNAPVLLMHGWTEIGADMRSVGERLAALGLRVIMPDRPGYGQSNPPYRTYTPDFYNRDARIMAAFLDTLGIDRAHIIGFSDGGEVALLMATLRPELPLSVIAWGAIGAYPADLCDRVRRGLPPTWITDDIRARHPGQNVDLWPYQWVDAFCAIIAAGGDVSLSKAHTIIAPTLLMLGNQDNLNPVSAGEQFVRAVGKKATLEVFPGVGHAIHESQPEAFFFAIRHFLRQHKLVE